MAVAAVGIAEVAATVEEEVVVATRLAGLNIDPAQYLVLEPF